MGALLHYSCRRVRTIREGVLILEGALTEVIRYFNLRLEGPQCVSFTVANISFLRAFEESKKRRGGRGTWVSKVTKGGKGRGRFTT